MPFTDSDLAKAMIGHLTFAGVVTIPQREKLLRIGPTEDNVRATLIPAQIARFQAYWNLLGDWMARQGGDINVTTGKNVPGRVNGNPTTITVIPIYNDAFNDVRTYIRTPGFSGVKAISNHLRFVSCFIE